MRNLFSLVGFLVVVFLGAGWYLGWYTFAWSSESNGRTKVAFDIDRTKVIDDAKSGAGRVGEFIENLKSKPTTSTVPQDVNFVGPPMPTELSTRKSAPLAGGLPGPTK
jgi:hypothetical protein